MGILESVKDFRNLGGLSYEQIAGLCCEIREKILDVTLKNGGHLASSLGAVELTVALLRIFTPERDKIIFDVGHQAYAYKILTKRLDKFDSMRKKGGIAGFPRIEESPYDFFTTGHSSTSISAALGYAKARDIKGENHDVVAVVGDGALLNGVSFEALNCVDAVRSKVIIILNDNKMSISPRVGGMAGHLAGIAVNPAYKSFKNFIKSQCHSMQHGETIEHVLSSIKSKLKSILLPTNIFEELGISYWGPFDGHNVAELEEVFKLAREYDKSLVIHVITKKGKGCSHAEESPEYFHGVTPGCKLDVPSCANDKKTQCKTWSAAMADCLSDKAVHDSRLVVCTAAMSEGTKLGAFAKRFPERFSDVGIAEEHMLVYAAGLAAGGMRPAVCIYSTFLQRAADQIVHDICIPKLPVLIGIDRAGLVGEDGETHHGILDLPWLRSIPEMTIAAPRDILDIEFFVKEWLERGIPFAIRYPRGTAPYSLSRSEENKQPAGWGKAEILRHGRDICFIGTGTAVFMMLEAARIIREKTAREVTVVDLRFIKPLDMETICPLLKSHRIVVTAEEAQLSGGVGEAIAAHALCAGLPCSVFSLGVPDKFISHASRDEQLEECGLTPENIAKKALEYEAKTCKA